MRALRFLYPHTLRRRFNAWLKRRIPASHSHRLHRKNIFIFISRVGVSFLFTIILLWVLATNYQNNIVLLLSFLLLSLLHTCIFYTYANLSGLSITVNHVTPCFAGESIKVDCVIQARSVGSDKTWLGIGGKQSAHRSIGIGWNVSSLVVVDVVGDEPQYITLWLPAPKRGRYRADRLRVMSRYPLGLMRAWALLDMDIMMRVYPKPLSTLLPSAQRVATHTADEGMKDSLLSLDMNDDVSHLREYQAGDSLRHVAWKVYAKGQGLATTVYESTVESEPQRWFCWDDFPGLAAEERLSRLCDCVLQAEHQHLTYGVVLPNHTTPLGQGSAHQTAVLSALADWGYVDTYQEESPHEV